MPKPAPRIPEQLQGRLVPFGPVKGVEFVTLHCLRRFVERAGVKGTVGRVLCSLEGWLDRAREADLKPGANVAKILGHGCSPARYWRIGSSNPTKGDWILVQVDRRLVTVHRNDTLEWIPKA